MIQRRTTTTSRNEQQQKVQCHWSDFNRHQNSKFYTILPSKELGYKKTKTVVNSYYICGQFM